MEWARIVPVITMSLGSSNRLGSPQKHGHRVEDSCDNAHSHRNWQPGIRRGESDWLERCKAQSNNRLLLSVRSWSDDCDTPITSSSSRWRGRWGDPNCLESCFPLDSNGASDQPDEAVQRVGGLSSEKSR